MKKLFEDNRVETLVKGLNFNTKSNKEEDMTDIIPVYNYNLDQLGPKLIRAQGANYHTSQKVMTTKDFPVNTGFLSLTEYPNEVIIYARRKEERHAIINMKHIMIII